MRFVCMRIVLLKNIIKNLVMIVHKKSYSNAILLNMTPLSITPKFNNNNLLEILIKNNSDQIFDSFKVCFSLVYSIKSLKGARIFKQIGRYYELITDYSNLSAHGSLIITITLQLPRIETYNMSCGPEGIFLIDKHEKSRKKPTYIF